MNYTITRDVDSAERYKIFLQLFAVFMDIKLPKKDVDILSLIYEKFNGKINKETRHMLAGMLDITEFNLNNYLKKLRDKGLIDKDSLHNGLMISKTDINSNMGIQFILKPKK
jgi:hypothetical protein